MLNSLFFFSFIFLVKTYFSLFSLYKHSLWNLSVNSWLAWKSNRNGILVCEIWCLFEILIFWSMMSEEEGVDLLPSLLTAGPACLFCAICSFYYTPIFKFAPPIFLFFFFAFFFIISLDFIYLFLSFFSKKDATLHNFFFIFLYLFYLVYFSVISCIFFLFI